jgi:hypothetical protein
MRQKNAKHTPAAWMEPASGLYVHNQMSGTRPAETRR